MSEQLTLLDAPESLSPRLRWMREKDVKVTQELGEGQTCDLTGEEGPLWAAWSGDWGGVKPQNMRLIGSRFIARAQSEEGAVVEFALINGWKLWNES